MHRLSNQTGVTLIETLVGLVVLSIGIGGAASLTSSSFASASLTSKQLVATGLAREAQEAVRNMRDTNWLKSNTLDSNCYDYVSGSNNALCYSAWQNNTDGRIFNLEPGGASDNYILDYDPSSATYWNFRKATGALTNRYRVYTQSGVNQQAFTQTSNSNPSIYYRKIVVAEESSAPYNQNVGPRLKITSQVWWTDKGCPVSSDWPGSDKCSVELISYLTNWKNY